MMKRLEKSTQSLAVAMAVMALTLLCPPQASAISPVMEKLNQIETTLDEMNGTAPAPVAVTGQTASTTAGDDGDLEKGVRWPHPRFTDNGNGTVTDNLTALIWLKNAGCFGSTNWSQAVSLSNGLADGQCGLTDGSVAGDWRLPNTKELQSLIHFGAFNTALPDTAGTGKASPGDPFDNLQLFYWSSTELAAQPSVYAWLVEVHHGSVVFDSKNTDWRYNVWSVRGGE